YTLRFTPALLSTSPPTTQLSPLSYTTLFRSEMGLDPVFERRKAEGIPTFREAAARVLAAHRKTWRNEKHEKQWSRTLETYVFPQIGNLQVSEITGPMIRNVLADIWLAKPETARRVRQRIGTVLDWAYASGYRES